MTGVTMPDVAQLFARFDSDAGSDGGARALFQMLVTDLVKVKHPDATTVEGPGNRDWGIDTVLGQLAGGSVFIWQSKYILEWQTTAPQSQVRSSFRSAVKHADEKHYKITAWTLVVPCKLAPEQLKWFQDWAKRESKKSGIAIELWDGTELRSQLITRDALDVRAEYFPHTVQQATVAAGINPSERVALTEDTSQFEGALFVRQLREAGNVETDSACAHFFATDALIRDYEAKGQDDAVASMAELHLEVHDIWERHFNQEVATAQDGGRMPRLLPLVIEGAASCPNPPGLHLARAHKKGTAHRLVEQKKAGWVAHWREIAASHEQAEPTPEAAQTEVSTTGIVQPQQLLPEPDATAVMSLVPPSTEQP
ncbi:hypothetical protein [Kribbella sindirgiensis]|uniref:Serine/threonine protein kinase n=1 Tax=Kribbella sindirgiensis TaxID=1124744 RepID=A0A4R0I6S2_9ACTN|nr:hypothetical protein [Kribbella sindirgiensis]TCC21670.1 hypothetical protein E0H50_35950 [Kribbella sindirgiensis]